MVQFSANDDPLDASGGKLRQVSGPAAGDGIRRGAFTAQSANQMLPLVERIVTDLTTLSHDLSEQGAQIRGIERLGKPTNLASFADELVAIKESFKTDRQRLEACHRELAALGVKVDSLNDGVIDFPAYLNRRPVMLCWKLGEPKVTHWHFLDEDFEERREIAGHCFDANPPSIAQFP